MKNFPIDLVYLWCDGSDPTFRKRKEAALNKRHSGEDIQATAEGRFVQVDELKYSLRSVEKYMPWIRHIFIVTDRQVPAWLNLNNPKVSIVDQSQILPADAIQIFNSNAVETGLYKIPELSEHFLYACDDMFVNRRIRPSFFFDRRGRIIVRTNYRCFRPKKSLYDRQLLYAQQKIRDTFGKSFPVDPHHNIDAYLKSDFAACATCFSQDFDRTAHHQFRRDDSLQRLIVHLYSVVKKHAVLKNVGVRWYHLKCRHLIHFRLDSTYLSNHRLFQDLRMRYGRYKPALFCINDGEHSDSDDRICTRKFLESRFPNPSAFEKPS